MKSLAFWRKPKFRKFVKRRWMLIIISFVLLLGFSPLFFIPLFNGDVNTLYTMWGAIPMVLLSIVNIWFTIKISINTDWSHEVDEFMDDFKDFMLGENKKQHQELLGNKVDLDSPYNAIKYYSNLINGSIEGKVNVPALFKNIIKDVIDQIKEYHQNQKIVEFNMKKQILNDEKIFDLETVDYLYLLIPLIYDLFSVYSLVEKSFFPESDKKKFIYYWGIYKKNKFMIQKIRAKYFLEKENKITEKFWNEKIILSDYEFLIFSEEGSDKIFVKSENEKFLFEKIYNDFDEFKENFHKDIDSLI